MSRGANRAELENSIQLLLELQQMFSILNGFSVKNSQLEITQNLYTIFTGIYRSTAEGIKAINQELADHRECLEELNKVEKMMAESEEEG